MHTHKVDLACWEVTIKQKVAEKFTRKLSIRPCQKLLTFLQFQLSRTPVKTVLPSLLHSQVSRTYWQDGFLHLQQPETRENVSKEVSSPECPLCTKMHRASQNPFRQLHK